MSDFTDVYDQNENIDAMAEQAVVHLIGSIFDKAVYLDPVVIHYNAGLASDGGMVKRDRSMRMERANFLMSHFAHIFIGLIINDNFRDAIDTAVKTEISLDTFPDDKKKELRKMMRIPYDKPPKGVYVLDLSGYNDKYYKIVSQSCAIVLICLQIMMKHCLWQLISFLCMIDLQ